MVSGGKPMPRSADTGKRLVLRMPAWSLHIFHGVKVHPCHSPEFMPTHLHNQNSGLCQQQGYGVRRGFIRFCDECSRTPQRIVQLLSAAEDVSSEAACGNLGIVGKFRRHEGNQLAAVGAGVV